MMSDSKQIVINEVDISLVIQAWSLPVSCRPHFHGLLGKYIIHERLFVRLLD